jgi:hypothetical protein
VRSTPTRLEPKHANLVVVSAAPLSAAEKLVWFNINRSFVKRAKAQRIAWRAPLHVQWAKMTAVQFCETVALDIPELAHAPDGYL